MRVPNTIGSATPPHGHWVTLPCALKTRPHPTKNLFSLTINIHHTAITPGASASPSAMQSKRWLESTIWPVERWASAGAGASGCGLDDWTHFSRLNPSLKRLQATAMVFFCLVRQSSTHCRAFAAKFPLLFAALAARRQSSHSPSRYCMPIRRIVKHSSSRYHLSGPGARASARLSLSSLSLSRLLLPQEAQRPSTSNTRPNRNMSRPN